MDVADALQFEREWESRSGSKPAAIRARFGVTSARYYQQLYAFLDDPATLQIDPMLVRRLIRLKDYRAAQRATRTFAGHDAHLERI